MTVFTFRHSVLWLMLSRHTGQTEWFSCFTLVFAAIARFANCSSLTNILAHVAFGTESTWAGRVWSVVRADGAVVAVGGTWSWYLAWRAWSTFFVSSSYFVVNIELASKTFETVCATRFASVLSTDTHFAVGWACATCLFIKFAFCTFHAARLVWYRLTAWSDCSHTRVQVCNITTKKRVHTTKHDAHDLVCMCAYLTVLEIHTNFFYQLNFCTIVTLVFPCPTHATPKTLNLANAHVHQSLSSTFKYKGTQLSSVTLV